VNLILLDEHDRLDDDLVMVSDARATHLLDVLRVTPGETVRIGRIDGPRGQAVVESASEGSVTLRCAFEDHTPDRPLVDVLLAVPRPKVMRRLWAQFAALGVGQIILTNAQRVERPYFDTHVLAETYYRPLLVEGLQQARDTRLPIVSVHRQFRILIEDRLDTLFRGGRRLVADASGQTSVSDAIAGDSRDRVLMAIGPEGGWNAFELDLLRRHGFQCVSMGPRTLRVDTACVALVALTHAALRRGSWSG
jgi:16S rRNA (uracil1498-N3)-methyltransferase